MLTYRAGGTVDTGSEASKITKPVRSCDYGVIEGRKLPHRKVWLGMVVLTHQGCHARYEDDLDGEKHGDPQGPPPHSQTLNIGEQVFRHSSLRSARSLT